MMAWIIKESYGFKAVELIKRTASTVFYVDRGWGGGETRAGKEKFLDWEGDEKTALALVEKLNSARAECEQRRRRAADWLQSRKAEILAQGMETGTAKTEGLGAKPDSPVPTGCAQTIPGA